MTTLGTGVTFSSGNGGTITMIGDVHHIRSYGVTADGWVYFDDLHFNPHHDMSLDLRDKRTRATVVHVTGDEVFTFDLTSQVVNGACDIRGANIKPNEWYRVQFDGALAETTTGWAHGKASPNGDLEFLSVRIPQ